MPLHRVDGGINNTSLFVLLNLYCAVGMAGVIVHVIILSLCTGSLVPHYNW